MPTRLSLATTDRPVIDAVVSGRNTRRGRPIYDVTPFTERPFRVNEHLRLELRIEVFNSVQLSQLRGLQRTYGSRPTPGRSFGHSRRQHQLVASPLDPVCAQGEDLLPLISLSATV
jgi:hypothetical protein